MLSTFSIVRELGIYAFDKGETFNKETRVLRKAKAHQHHCLATLPVVQEGPHQEQQGPAMAG
jgi:hypothetical protein